MLRKLIIVPIMIFILILSSFSVTHGASFNDVDVQNSALCDAVDFLFENGITKGISQTEFGTAENVTREQMAAFIYRAKNDGKSPGGVENTTAFTDLKDPTFYAMISWANENGIIKGVSQTEFNPTGSIILQDAYTMLVRALDYEQGEDFVYPNDYISKAKEIGLDKNLDTGITLTSDLKRGHVAILLHNAFMDKSSHILDGKKVILIGNSFTYYGKTVIDKWNNVDDATMQERFDDKGYFYQLCRQNGADVSVTNWTWGGHTLGDTFGGNCKADRGHDGHDHLSDLKRLCDMNYDYVVIQPGSGDTDDTARESIKQIQDLFKSVNSNVKFIYNIHPRYYLRGTDNDKILLAGVENTAKELGLTVANWGVIVNDIINGTAVVEGSELEYNKNTFIITKSKSDGYHPNMLSGYITTQVLYSTITGQKAEGEDYSFCTDETVHPKFSLQKYLDDYYKYDNISAKDSETKLTGDELTTFPEVFASSADMLGIQKIIDSYLGLEG